MAKDKKYNVSCVINITTTKDVFFWYCIPGIPGIPGRGELILYCSIDKIS